MCGSCVCILVCDKHYQILIDLYITLSLSLIWFFLVLSLSLLLLLFFVIIYNCFLHCLLCCFVLFFCLVCFVHFSRVDKKLIEFIIRYAYIE